MSVFLDINDDNFYDNINCKEYVLVYFWASWCSPCMSFKNILIDLYKDYNKKIKFLKFDIDNSKNIISKYNINSVPTIILFKNSKVLFKKTGLFTKYDIVSFFKLNGLS